MTKRRWSWISSEPSRWPAQGLKTNKPILTSLPTSSQERRHSRGNSAAFNFSDAREARLPSGGNGPDDQDARGRCSSVAKTMGTRAGFHRDADESHHG